MALKFAALGSPPRRACCWSSSAATACAAGGSRPASGRPCTGLKRWGAVCRVPRCFPCRIAGQLVAATWPLDLCPCSIVSLRRRGSRVPVDGFLFPVRNDGHDRRSRRSCVNAWPGSAPFERAAVAPASVVVRSAGSGCCSKRVRRARHSRLDRRACGAEHSGIAFVHTRRRPRRPAVCAVDSVAAQCAVSAAGGSSHGQAASSQLLADRVRECTQRTGALCHGQTSQRRQPRERGGHQPLRRRRQVRRAAAAMARANVLAAAHTERAGVADPAGGSFRLATSWLLEAVGLRALRCWLVRVAVIGVVRAVTGAIRTVMGAVRVGWVSARWRIALARQTAAALRVVREALFGRLRAHVNIAAGCAVLPFLDSVHTAWPVLQLPSSICIRCAALPLLRSFCLWRPVLPGTRNICICCAVLPLLSSFYLWRPVLPGMRSIRGGRGHGCGLPAA
eukprot:366462-Chlamydomonas_euryale.AAC.43